LLLALFHYHDEFYSLSEKIAFDTRDNSNYPKFVDPCLVEVNTIISPSAKKPLVNNDKLFVEWLHLQHNSVFGKSDGNKKIDKVRNIVSKIPRETVFNYSGTPYDHYRFKYEYRDFEYDRKCYIIRNPFRVAISHLRHFYNMRGSPWQKLDGWKIKEKVLESVIDWTCEQIEELKKDTETQINSKMISLEYFINNFEDELPKLINWADSDASPIIDRNIGEHYYNNVLSPWHTVNCKQVPNEAGCLKKATEIKWAGGFKPTAKPTLERLMHEDIHHFFADVNHNSQMIKYLIKLGPDKFDYWYNDKDHNYANELNLF